MRRNAMNIPYPRLVTRRDYHARWIWELVGEDRHVLNRSGRNFATKQECEADALQSGQTLDPVPVINQSYQYT